MNKTLILISLLAIISVAAAASKADAFSSLWASWKVQHKKTYSAAEEITRLGIFVENIDKIMRLNSESQDVKYALNQFTDLTATEFKLKHVNGGLFEPHRKFIQKYTQDYQGQTLPDTVDWRSKGAVTPVKNQGQCGSCWTFSTTGVLESFYFINNGKLVTLSEQQIVDCATDAGQGCSGGWPYLAIEYAVKYGLESEADYPYHGIDESCHYDASKALKVASGYAFVKPKSSDQLKAALVNQPVSVLIEADQSVFQFYSQGVISTGCGANLDHAVLAVGYQKVGALEAFIVKNSWGASWGSSGYVYISTIQQLNQGSGACGILAQPLVPTK